MGYRSNIKLIHSDPSIRNITGVKRFFNCPSFEVFYLIEKKDSSIESFRYFIIGSIFIAKLLDTFAESVQGANISTISEKINVLENNTWNHQYLAALDKKRFMKFVHVIGKELSTN